MNYARNIIVFINKSPSARLRTAFLLSILSWFILYGFWFISELMGFLPFLVIMMTAFLNDEKYEENVKPKKVVKLNRGMEILGIILAAGGVLGIIMLLWGILGIVINIFVSKWKLIIVDTLPLVAERSQYFIGGSEVPRFIYLCLKSSGAFFLCGLSLCIIVDWGLPEISPRRRRKR